MALPLDSLLFQCLMQQTGQGTLFELRDPPPKEVCCAGLPSARLQKPRSYTRDLRAQDGVQQGNGRRHTACTGMHITFSWLCIPAPVSYCESFLDMADAAIPLDLHVQLQYRARQAGQPIGRRESCPRVVQAEPIKIIIKNPQPANNSPEQNLMTDSSLAIRPVNMHSVSFEFSTYCTNTERPSSHLPTLPEDCPRSGTDHD